MESQEDILKNEIRDIFSELIKEEDDRFDLTTKRTIYPRNFVYVRKAKELYEKAVELEKLNNKYDTYHLKDVMSEEVDRVDRHNYEYNGNIPTAKSVTKLQNLMLDATRHIQLYYYNVLGDIIID